MLLIRVKVELLIQVKVELLIQFKVELLISSGGGESDAADRSVRRNSGLAVTLQPRGGAALRWRRRTEDHQRQSQRK